MPQHRSCIPIAYMNWLLICRIHNGKAQFSKKQISWDLVILYLIRIKVTMVSQALIFISGVVFTSFVHEIEISICCSVSLAGSLSKLETCIGMYSAPCTIPTTTTTATTTRPPPPLPPHHHRHYHHTPTPIGFILLAFSIE